VLYYGGFAVVILLSLGSFLGKELPTSGRVRKVRGATWLATNTFAASPHNPCRERLQIVNMTIISM